MTKICSKCKQELETKYFSKDSRSSSGLTSCCNQCRKKSYEKNKEKILAKQKEYNKKNKEKISARNREYGKKHRDKAKIREKKYRDNNKEKKKEYAVKHKEKISEYHKLYRIKNKEKLKERKNELRRWKLKEDVSYKLEHNIRCRIRMALKNNSKTSSSKELLGCSIEELKKHLEKQFKEGMSWNNYCYRSWHIDHIIPVAKYNLLLEEEQKKCFHYTNLQPLWAEENMKKGNRI
jgi:hypothetical protein